MFDFKIVTKTFHEELRHIIILFGNVQNQCDRLVWYLESSSLITEAKSGFRKTRSTMDHLVRFETFVREGFLKGEHVVSIFFDLEKAYDTTWK